MTLHQRLSQCGLVLEHPGEFDIRVVDTLAHHAGLGCVREVGCSLNFRRRDGQGTGTRFFVEDEDETDDAGGLTAVPALQQAQHALAKALVCTSAPGLLLVGCRRRFTAPMRSRGC